MEMLSTQHPDNVLQHEIGGEPCTPPHPSSSAAAATATTTTMPNTMAAAVARFHDENQKRVPQAQAQRSTSMADAEDSPNSSPLMQHLMEAFSNDGVGWAGQPHPHVEEEKMLFAEQQQEEQQQQHLHEEAPIPIGAAAEELSDASSAASFDFIRNALTDIIHLQRKRVAAAASSNHNHNSSHGSSMPHHHPSQQQQQQPSHVVEPNETHLPQSRRAAPDVPSPISGGDVGGMHRRLPASWLPHCDVVVVAPTRAAGYRRGAEMMKAHEAQHEVHDDDDDEEEVEVIERYIRPFSPLFHASSHVGVASLDAHAHSTQPPLSTSCTPSSVSMPAQGAYDAYLAQLQHQQRQHKQVLQRQQLVGRGRDDDVVAVSGRRGVAQSSLHHTNTNNNNNNSSTPTKNTTTRGIHVVSGGHRWRQSPVRADYHFSTTPSTSPSKSFGREMEDRSPIVAAAAMAAVAPPFHPPLHHQHHHQEAYVVAEEIMIPHVSALRGVMEVGHVGQHDGDDDAVARRRGVVAGAATPPPLPSSPHSDEGRNQSPVEAFADVLSTEKARFDSAAAFSTPMKPPLAVPTLQRTPMAAMVAKAAAAAAAAAAAGEGGRNNGSQQQQQQQHHHQPVMTMLASRRKGCSVLSSPRSHSSALMGRGPHRRPPPATTKYLRRTNNMVVDADHNGDDDDDALPIFADSLVGAAIADLFPRIQRRQQHIHHACMEGTAPRTSSSSLASTPAAPSAAPSSSQQEALVYFYGRGYRLLSANH